MSLGLSSGTGCSASILDFSLSLERGMDDGVGVGTIVSLADSTRLLTFGVMKGVLLDVPKSTNGLN